MHASVREDAEQLSGAALQRDRVADALRLGGDAPGLSVLVAGWIPDAARNPLSTSEELIRLYQPPRAAVTIVLILPRLSVRSGHVESVATHCASDMAQPQGQRARFAACKAVFFSFALSTEKSTPWRSASVKATPDIVEKP
jgi:hypothetical protein